MQKQNESCENRQMNSFSKSTVSSLFHSHNCPFFKFYQNIFCCISCNAFGEGCSVHAFWNLCKFLKNKAAVELMFWKSYRLLNKILATHFPQEFLIRFIQRFLISQTTHISIYPNCNFCKLHFHHTRLILTFSFDVFCV